MSVFKGLEIRYLKLNSIRAAVGQGVTTVHNKAPRLTEPNARSLAA